MLENIFDEMKSLGEVRSADDFSMKWLGRERSYMRCLRSKRREPSAQVLETCAVRLLRSADSVDAGLTYTRREKMRSLANTCLEELLSIGARH